MKRLLLVAIVSATIAIIAAIIFLTSAAEAAPPMRVGQTVLNTAEFCYRCDLTGPDGVPDGAITLQDVSYVLGQVGTRAPTPVPTPSPFVGDCYFVDGAGLWELRSNSVWPQTFHGQEVVWWWEIDDVVQPWEYFTTLNVQQGNGSTAIIDAHVPGSGDIYAGIPQLDGSITPWAATCEFSVGGS